MFLEKIELNLDNYINYNIVSNKYNLYINKSLIIEVGRVTTDRYNKKIIFQNIKILNSNKLTNVQSVIDFFEENLNDIIVDYLIK